MWPVEDDSEKRAPSSSIPSDLAQCAFVDVILADPRPTCLAELHKVTRDRHPIFWNPAFERLTDLYAYWVSGVDNACASSWAKFSTWASLATSKEANTPPMECFNTRWTSFTIQGRWKVLCAESHGPTSDASKIKLPLNPKTNTESLAVSQSENPNANGAEKRSVPATNNERVTIETALSPSIGPSRILGYSPYVEFFRKFDWASTELGAISTWPKRLVEVCNTILAHPDPIGIYWGRNAILLYNEPIIETVGGRHPDGLGQRVETFYPEVWENQFQPLVESIFKKEHPFIRLNERRTGYKNGLLAEVFWDVTFVPILAEGNQVVGIYTQLFDITKQHLWQRRTNTLLALTAAIQTAESVDAVWTSISDGIGPEDRDIPHLLVYTVTESAEPPSKGSWSPIYHLRTSLGYNATTAPYEEVSITSDQHGLAGLFRKTVVADGPLYFNRADAGLIPDFWDAFSAAGDTGPCIGICIMAIYPSESGKFLALLVIGVNALREFDSDYKTFASLVQKQVSSTVASILLREEGINRERLAAQEAAHKLEVWKAEAKSHELRFTRLAETAPIGISTYAADCSLTYSNSVWCSMTGMSTGQDSSATDWWQSLIHPDDLAMVGLQLQTLLQTRQATTFEFRLKAQPAYVGTTILDHYTWILCSADAKSVGGGPETIIAYYTDITKQKMAEDLQHQRLQDVMEAKRQQEAFIDLTSHEIRNPLSVVLQSSEDIISTATGSLANLEKGGEPLDPEDLISMIDAAETIKFCALHQKCIVDDILTLSKLDSNLLPVTPIESQPRPLIRSVMKLFGTETRKSGIDMVLKVHKTFDQCHLDDVRMDPNRVNQIVINLIANALKFTRNQETRVVEVLLGGSIGKESVVKDWPLAYMPRQLPRENSDFHEDWTPDECAQLHVAVLDTGAGIPVDEQNKIFARFSQASPRTHVEYGSSGLGLFICRALSESHGGQIGFKSTSGRGSAFGFCVEVGRCSSPKAAATPENQVKVLQKSTQRSPGIIASSAVPVDVLVAEKISPSVGSKQEALNLPALYILVVEDNILNQKILKKQLQKAGHTVEVAQHGQEALDLLAVSPDDTGQLDHNRRFDVIFMDIEMPVMDGLTCTQRIREAERSGKMVGHTPIIAITGNARDEHIQKALAAGMDQVVLKPYSLSVLLPIARKLQQRHGKG